MMSYVEEDLERIRAELVEMGGRVEEMIADATRAMVERDSALAESVIRADPTIDSLEKSIDEDCILLLALQEPKAIDFRNIIAIQKIVSDLERMGDSAVNIAQGVLRLNAELPLEPGGRSAGSRQHRPPHGPRRPGLVRAPGRRARPPGRASATTRPTTSTTGCSASCWLR